MDEQIADAHELDWSSADADGACYARCSCGWQSRAQPSVGAASAELNDHLRAVGAG